jgi:N-acetylneuraminic acid mutarotase
MTRKMKFRNLAAFIFIAFSITLPSLSFAQEIEWMTKANMPTARSWFSTSVVNGKIYAIGGYLGGGLVTAVEEYDPAKNTWTKKADMLKASAYLTTCAVDGKIYAIGGGGGHSRIEQYDPVTDQWTRKTNMTNGRGFLGVSVVNGKIYAIGGNSGEGTVSIVEVYDPTTDSWSRKTDMPTERASLSTGVVNGKIYAIGGDYWDNVNSIGANYATVEEYDPTTDTWTTKTPLPTPTYDPATVVVDGKIYVIGGVGAVSEELGAETYFLSDVMKYDPAIDIWTKEGDLRVPRTALSASVVAGRIYVIGGHEVKVEPITTVEAYQPAPWSFAHGPIPADGALHSDTWVNLSWSSGDFAASHNVYFGDSFDAVNDGSSDTFLGNQIPSFRSVGLPGSPYPEGLVRGQRYYWRIDEVNDTEPDSPWKGPVWSFTIQPQRAYNPNPPDCSEFIDLDVELNWSAGVDAALHTVYFDDNFDDVNNAAADLSQRGSVYTQNSMTYTPGLLEFGKTYYWRVDELTGGRSTQVHKGDIWSFTTRGAAGSPNPSNGAIRVGMNPILSWTPADDATIHQIYFGTDKEAVRNADTNSPEYKGTQMLGNEGYDPGILSWDTTYFWRVDEITSDNPDNPLPGSVWSFTTGYFLVIDDFESYNTDNQIWWSWKDGTGDANHPTEPPYAGNGSGSKVGDESTDSTAGDYRVHEGQQSMPFWYDNSKTGFLQYSETTLTLSSMRDWTENGVRTLSIWFACDWDWRTDLPTNEAELMYVVINDDAVVYHNNPDVAIIYGWTEWRIDLQEFVDQGVDLTNVHTIGIGFGDRNNPQPGGKGLMSFDDIRLYRPSDTPGE